MDQPPPIPRPRSFSLWWVLVAFAMLVVALVLASPLGIYLYSKHRWEAVQAELRAKGEKLTAREVEWPAVPDAENFFADPVWKEQKRPDGSRLAGWEKLNPPVSAEERERLRAKYPEVTWGEKSNVRYTVALTAWTKRPEKASPEELKQTAYYIQETLGPATPFLERVESLSARPQAVYPLEFERGMAMSLPHLSGLLKAGQLFMVRAKSEMVLGDSRQAFADAKEILSLSDRVKEEPVVISFLVRASLINLALDVMAEGIKTHIWTDSQLQEFDHQLAGINFLPNLLKALRGERINFNTTVESMRNGDIGKELSALSGDGQAPPSASKTAFSLWYSFSGRFDQADCNSLLQEWIEELQLAPTHGLPAKPSIEAKIEKLYSNPLGKFTHILTLLTMPACTGANRRMAETQDRVSMAREACALERYWLKNGKYPESLAALEPEYLAEPLRSVVDLQPFHYKLEPPAGYLLYSIGLDHKDDGGRPAYKSEPGDWVWGKFAKAPAK